MKRILAVCLLFAGILLGSSLVVSGTAGAENLNNFRITSYSIDYQLSRNDEGHSILQTSEIIVADFASANTNHGIERLIPAQFDGRPLKTTIISVQNGDGVDLKYTTRSEGDGTIVRIGDPDAYVYGEQTYKITYSQIDVTKYANESGLDEWYWDTNGTQWLVPIDSLNISINMSDDIMAARVGEPSCYWGEEGSTNTCTVTQNADGSYSVSMARLFANQNVTVAFGFSSGTFAAYQMSFWDWFARIWQLSQIVTLGVAFVVFVVWQDVYKQRMYRRREEKPIAVEYTPPEDTSVLAAAQVVASRIRGEGLMISALLIDLAVRRYISIVETKPKRWFASADYEIVINKDLSPLYNEEKEELIDMFKQGGLPSVCDKLALKSLQKDLTYFSRRGDNSEKLDKLAIGAYGLMEKPSRNMAYLKRWALVVFIAALVTLSIPLVVVALVIWGQAYASKSLSDKGLALRRYLLGLEMYIKASETERLAFAQAPDTAEKVQLPDATDKVQLPDVADKPQSSGAVAKAKLPDTTNNKQMIKLYEKLLPYAVLFGLEKKWAKELGDFYNQAQVSPDWYSGTTAFNAVYFAQTLSSFTQTSQYLSSSTSGGSGVGGVGSSGGGGGGGGGGGW